LLRICGGFFSLVQYNSAGLKSMYFSLKMHGRFNPWYVNMQITSLKLRLACNADGI